MLPSKLVLAEDNPADALLVREALQEHGILHELQVLTDGAMAMAFVDRLEQDVSIPCPDLLLLDVNLPKLNGRDILARVTSSNRWKATPVVLFAEGGRKASNSNVHYFPKPGTLEGFLELGTLVKSVLEHSARS